MSSAGEYPEFVNAQKFTLTNLTDNQLFNQITNLSFDINRAVHSKALADGQREKLFGVSDNAMEFDITLTIPEVISWVAYTTLVSGDLPSKNWELKGTDENGNSFTLVFAGKVVSFTTTRPRDSASRHHVRDEADNIEVTVS